MMKLLGILCLVVLLTSCTRRIANDPTACKKVEDKLRIIKNYVEGKDPDPHLQRVGAVFFLTVLTGIESESPGNDIGQLDPTIDDYKKWSRWYENNKDKLYWDQKTNQVIVRK